MHSLRLPFAAAVLALELLGASAGAAQAVIAPSSPPPIIQAQVAPQKAQPARVAQASRVEASPRWAELGSEQQQALRPLAGVWSTLSEPHKRKWIALSSNYRQLSRQEQDKLHSRMHEWAVLSPQQRAAARLNFAETQGVSPDDKKAKWEAYQALSPEEKKKLRAGARRPTAATPAAAVRPVPAQRLANVPRSDRQTRPPRIATGPLPESTPPTPGEHAN
ncbi:MAG TPA: DUF3106 domain-containing protein [Ramlibacter sp.]|nr:DUF3106 domain-containing protein [Ramlibacter sp.]